MHINPVPPIPFSRYSASTPAAQPIATDSARHIFRSPAFLLRRRCRPSHSAVSDVPAILPAGSPSLLSDAPSRRPALQPCARIRCQIRSTPADRDRHQERNHCPPDGTSRRDCCKLWNAPLCTVRLSAPGLFPTVAPVTIVVVVYTLRRPKDGHAICGVATENPQRGPIRLSFVYCIAHASR